MAVVVATRFKVSSARHLPRFLVGTVRVALQARRSAGFLGGRMRIEPGGGAYWTLTRWRSGRDMVAFRDTGVHAVLMPKLAGWAGEALFGVWNSDGSQLPDWHQVSRRVAEHPKFGSLDRPAPAHVAEHFDPARRFGLDLPIPTTRRARRDIVGMSGTRLTLATATADTREKILIALTVVGFLVPNGLLVAFVVRHGLDPGRYFSQWIQLLPSAQLAADLAICCVAFLGWTVWDGPRCGVRRWWVGFPATALVGLCFAVPLYLLLRERATRH